MRNIVRLGAFLLIGLLASGLTSGARAAVTSGKYNFTSARVSHSLFSDPLARVSASPRKRTRRPVVHDSRRAGYAACRSAARKFGVPMATALAVCRLESGFRCSAVGRAGELGLLQIKLATARALGYRGSRRGLLSCATGAYWGMKHLALAIRHGGVWKHNAGLYARRPNAQARQYSRLVANLRRRYL